MWIFFLLNWKMGDKVNTSCNRIICVVQLEQSTVNIQNFYNWNKWNGWSISWMAFIRHNIWPLITLDKLMNPIITLVVIISFSSFLRVLTYQPSTVRVPNVQPLDTSYLTSSIADYAVPFHHSTLSTIPTDMQGILLSLFVVLVFVSHVI